MQPNDDDPKHVPVYTVPSGNTAVRRRFPERLLVWRWSSRQGSGSPKSSATTFGVQYGIVGHGCRAQAADGLGNVPYIGATNTVTLTIPPGRQQIAAYATDDHSRTKKPPAGPVTIAANARGRTYVLTSGLPHHPQQLLTVPIPSS